LPRFIFAQVKAGWLRSAQSMVVFRVALIAAEPLLQVEPRDNNAAASAVAAPTSPFDLVLFRSRRRTIGE
jgi:uncharacterized protein YcaQ